LDLLKCHANMLRQSRLRHPELLSHDADRMFLPTTMSALLCVARGITRFKSLRERSMNNSVSSHRLDRILGRPAHIQSWLLNPLPEERIVHMILDTMPHYPGMTNTVFSAC